MSAFTPDWDELADVLGVMTETASAEQVARDVIAAYREQLQRSGYVVVRRADLAYLRKHHQLVRAEDTKGMSALQRTAAILAAPAPEAAGAG